jgi:myosin heavy subunit
MPQFKWNKVELLDRRHPGLKHFVQACYDDGVSRDKISQRVRQKYGVHISTKALQRYRERRYLPHLKRIQETVEELEALTEYRKRHPEGPLREALIFKKLFRMTTRELMRRDVDMKRQEAQNRKLEIEKKRAGTQAKALRAKLEEVKASQGRDREKVRRAAARAKNEEELRKKIDEIYGIGGATAGPAPVSSEVGQ